MNIYNNHTLSQLQLNELKIQAIWIMEQRKLEELPWDRAWLGGYPEKPTNVEIFQEWKSLREKAERFLSGNVDLEYEHFHHEDRTRMIALVNCESFDIRGHFL